MWNPAEAIAISAEEKSLLEQLVSAGSTPQNVAFRIRVVLGAAEGVSNNELAGRLSTTRTTILKWRRRFADCGIEGILTDAPRSGRKKSISAEKEAAIVEATLKTKPRNATHWSTRMMAATQKVSDTTVHRIWRAHRLQPHRVEKFKASQDPEFVHKLRDIVGLYRNPPENALVFSVDEKSQIQALDRTQPILPLREGLPERQTHDYRRYGTTTLFAALNVLDGTVIGHCSPRHRHQEFLKFLKKLDESVVKGQQLHLVLDNYGTHKHPVVKAWLCKRPNYHLHFTPTSSSWLNLVERFFAEITQRRIRRGTFPSVPALVNAITDYIRARNKKARPFTWVASADQIIQKVRRCRAISEAGH
jgi:transposase